MSETMKVTAPREVLADLLSRAALAADSRASSQPALAGVLLDARDGKLHTTTTDTGRQLALQLSAEVTVELEGKALAPAALLSRYVLRMPEGKVALEVKEGSIVISGDGPEFALRLLDAGDYPNIEAEEAKATVTIDGDALFATVARVAPAVGSDQSRPTLTGMLVEVADGYTNLVATDSYRLAVGRLDASLGEGQVLLPAAGGTLSKVEKAIGGGELTMSLGDRTVVFSNSQGSAHLRLIEGRFPVWASLLPESPKAEARFSVKEFRAAMSRIELMSESHTPVTLTFSDEGLRLAVNRADVGHGGETIACEYTGEEPMTIGVNPKYLGDGISVLSGDTVRLRLTDPHRPVLVGEANDDSFTYLVMPIRL